MIVHNYHTVGVLISIHGKATIEHAQSCNHCSSQRSIALDCGCYSTVVRDTVLNMHWQYEEEGEDIALWMVRGHCVVTRLR